jgi:hypothetical protein
MIDSEIMGLWLDNHVRYEWMKNRHSWCTWTLGAVTFRDRALPGGYRVMITEDSANGEVTMCLLDQKCEKIAEAKV